MAAILEAVARELAATGEAGTEMAGTEMAETAVVLPEAMGVRALVGTAVTTWYRVVQGVVPRVSMAMRIGMAVEVILHRSLLRCRRLCRPHSRRHLCHPRLLQPRRLQPAHLHPRHHRCHRCCPHHRCRVPSAIVTLAEVVMTGDAMTGTVGREAGWAEVASGEVEESAERRAE